MQKPHKDNQAAKFQWKSASLKKAKHKPPLNKCYKGQQKQAQADNQARIGSYLRNVSLYKNWLPDCLHCRGFIKSLILQ